MVKYKRREGVVSSVAVKEEDLKVIQLQGAKQEGFRVDSGLNWIALFADQILQIVSHPDSRLARITMPPTIAIQGFVDATDAALTKYSGFAHRLGMRFSQEERLLVRDIR